MLTLMILYAIQEKNDNAQRTAGKASAYLAIISTVIFLIALSFSINFPSIITKPISQLKEAVDEITNQNYKHRIHIDTKDEFGNLANAFNTLAAKLDAYESSNLQIVLFEKARAEAVINSLKDASIGIDKSNNILFVNQQASNLLGLKSAEVTGKSVNEIAAGNDLLRFLLKNDKSSPFKIVENNKENYYSKEIYHITNDKEELGSIIELKNITSFQEKDVAKTNFLATISHELKTPLASSDIGLKLLQNEKTGSLSNQQKEIISDLQKDNQRLIKLVSELLDLSQAETGNINLSITGVNAKEIIEFAAASMKQQAAEKEIGIELSVNADVWSIKADREKAIWVLINLLSNAIRYSPTGEKIIVSAQNIADRKVEITVSDQGPGISKEYHEKIFQRFFKVPNTASFEKGTGLGLSISKEFMTAMGGDILIKSLPGSGSQFILHFKVSS